MREVGRRVDGCGLGIGEEICSREAELVQQLEAMIDQYVIKENEGDRWVWKEESAGIHTVNYAYKCLRCDEAQVMDITLQQVWNKLVPLKVTTFVWKLMWNRVPTKDNLIKRGTLRDTQSICPACSQMEESANHLFFECDVTYKAWAGCDLGFASR